MLNTIVTGDCRELCKDIPNESIDLIFTDPPYPKEFLPLYEWLCNEAMRVLKPGGFCCFIAASLYLDKIFEFGTKSGLSYYFKIETMNGFDKPIIWPRKVLNASKPILMWTKGKGEIVVPNMLSVYAGQGPDKRFHHWGQDEGSARYVISYVVGDGEARKYPHKRPVTLLEPFCGGGATLEACKWLGVDYIAFEIDPVAAETAQQRMDGCVPTKFEKDQMALFA